MRITNKMMTNNMMSNINRNKLHMSKLEEQYATGKKIQKPSDDPIITVRALKLRTNLTEIEQYHEKNIPDAMSWMEVTESALDTVNDILQQINTYCVQGSSDTLTPKDRSFIVQNLEQMKEQIYQEGNSNYAGRYVFSGYKTDSSLTFMENAPTLNYSITEDFDAEQIQILNKVNGRYLGSDIDGTSPLTDAPELISNYRIQLAYNNTSKTEPVVVRLYDKNPDGTMSERLPSLTIAPISANDPSAYSPAATDAHYIYETGEIIFGESVYNDIRTADKISVEYDKSGFQRGDLKPEHFFNCTMSDSLTPEKDPVIFERDMKEGQKIQYEVNFNQKLTINTEAKDAFSPTIGRRIEDILNAVNDVVETEKNIAELEKRLSDNSLSDADREYYEKLKEMMNTQLGLEKEVMQQAFAKGMTVSAKEQDRVNAAVADLGSRYVRLELTENRLSSQKVDFEELLSQNEDVDLVDTIVKYNVADTIYKSSLNAASRVVQNTLLDFL
ncbi:flagellar hook-associated protein FlgL [Lachnospiraceae bacterium MD1]|uniref:Flagellar hook-associated protein FlgL n=1 Tax=Variimorphobacter saccharofermentans TaxID=2755051 RepID=A0A839K4T5_9FIRM|nr:flagellar hook-associated protein FlgL [Variimorphobacter saccharofermentans]MBB2184202.1 flagellar hook-associated protein FlgL [Variimorphobacter saccharofermentans]